jgi:hypothetical protein
MDSKTWENTQRTQEHFALLRTLHEAKTHPRRATILKQLKAVLKTRLNWKSL